MIFTVLYIILYYMCCVAFFNVVQRPLFLVSNRSLQPLGAGIIKSVYRHGFRTDTIAAPYLTAVPLLIIWVATYAGLDLSMTMLLASLCLEKTSREKRALR